MFYAKNIKRSSGSKHINIEYLVVRDNSKQWQIVNEHTNAKAIIVDPLTKGPKLFNQHVVSMGVLSPFDLLG